MVEFLDLGEADIDLRLTTLLSGFDQLRQTVQCLGAEHQIDVRCTFDDVVAFLTGDATTYADNEIGSFLLDRDETAKQAENLVFGLLPYRAGVEQDDIGFVGVIGL